METTNIPEIKEENKENQKPWLTRERGVWLGVSSVLFLAVLFLLIRAVVVSQTVFAPAPHFTDFPGTTNDEKVNLKGSVGPNLGVVLFDKDGKVIATAMSDGEGNFLFEDLALAEGENKFIARALDTGKKSTKPSAEIVVKMDPNAPDLEVGAPENASVSEKDYVMTGKAEPGSKVIVNGVEAVVADDGTWSATVPLSAGTNTLTVTATDAAGNQAVTTTEVTYTPPAPAATNTNSETGTNTNAPAEGEGTNTNGETNANTNTAANANTNTAPPPADYITVTASVSNQTPNVKSNETITATVKDSAGNPVTGAKVAAVAHYKAGNVTYNLTHLGGGQYSVSFKIGTGSESGYRVSIDVTATYNNMTDSTQVSFTPR